MHMKVWVKTWQVNILHWYTCTCRTYTSSTESSNTCSFQYESTRLHPKITETCTSHCMQLILINNKIDTLYMYIMYIEHTCTHSH